MADLTERLAAGLGASLIAEVTTLAICWRIVRRDGVALGLVSHDRPLRIDGMLYAAAPGISPSAVVQGDGIEVDTMAVEGALRSDAITAADLAQGRFDGAAVTLFMVDWQNPEGGAQWLAEGRLGTVAIGSGPDAGFSASLRGPTAALSVTAIESYSPECRAELGDRRCRVAMRGRRRRGLVGATGTGWLSIEGLAAPDDHLQGMVRVLSGPLAGLERRIIAVTGAQLQLDEVLAIAAGTSVELTEGCDKRFATCAGRFANAANFRGEPHVPGGDLLTRYGGV